jgi:peptide deformylase
MKLLPRSQFGNPILRQVAKPLTKNEIVSDEIQKLIKNMHFILSDKKLGVGLAAPQVGKSVALAVINIQKTELRPDVKPFKLTIINPVITKTYGRKTQRWEGCISSGAGKAGLFAKVPRYKKIELEYQDEKGKKQIKTFKDLQAHVIQHEVDHLNGILFVDRVKDTKTYMTYAEYKKAREQKLID